MNRRHFLNSAGALVSWVALPALSASPLPEVQVFKSPTCGCCGAWVTHMRSTGFTVKVIEVNDAGVERKRLGMPDRYGSCHTATVDGYLLEGHVPAAEVKRLLAKRPKALGLAAPGMPQSAPGMDVPGRKDPYQVLLVDASGQSSVFANYPK
ncbi:MAG: metal-binding protein [Leptothrix sp. (in: Bacteria)]|nr:metal-binding protein [Leptothrix sp. (in: b-proteobacteria)]